MKAALTARAWLFTMPVVIAQVCSVGLGRERLSTSTGLIGIRIHKFEASAHQVLLKIQLSLLEVNRAFGVDDHLHALEVVDLIILPDFLVEVDGVAQP